MRAVWGAYTNLRRLEYGREKCRKFETKSELLANTVDNRRNCRLIQ